MASIFFAPKSSPTSAGANYSSARLYFYDTGTTTPANSYVDGGLITAHEIPVESDANGVFPVVYLDPSKSYRVQLKDSDDSLIYDVDPYQPVFSDEDIGAAINGQEDAEADHVPEIVTSRYRYAYGNLKRYTSNNGDGSTDVSEAFQNMLESGALLCTIPAPADEWIIANQVTWVNGVTVTGPRGCQLRSTVASGEWTFVFDGVPYAQGANFSGFLLNIETAGAKGIQLWESRNCRISDFEILGPAGIGGYGIEINGGDDASSSWGSAHNYIFNGRVYKMAAGIRMYTDNTTTPASTTAFCNRNWIFGVQAQTCTEGLFMDRANTNEIHMSLQANTEGLDIGTYAKNNILILECESNARHIVSSLSADSNTYGGNVLASMFVDSAGVAIDPHVTTSVVGSQLFQLPREIALPSSGQLRLSNPYDASVIRIRADDTFDQNLVLGSHTAADANVDLLGLMYDASAPYVKVYESLMIDKALDHDGTTAGFYGKTPVARPSVTWPNTATATTTLNELKANRLMAALVTLGLIVTT